MNDKILSSDDLINNLANILANLAKPAFPLDVELWDTETVANYFKKAPHVARRSIICQPSFPKAVRIEKTARPLYFANEVIDWAKTRKDKN